MRVAQLIDILKTHEADSVVVLPEYNCYLSQEKLEVVELRSEEVKLVELYQIDHKGTSLYTLDDGTGPPIVAKSDMVFDKKVTGVLLGWA